MLIANDNTPVPTRKKAAMKEKADIYEKITADIIEAIEAGCGKFELAWHTSGILPTNASNHRRYTSVNTLALWAVASRRGFKTNL